MLSPRLFTLSFVAALAVSAPAAAAEVRLVSRDEPVPGASVVARGALVLPARAAPRPFNLAGLHWRGSGTVWFRTRASAGLWSAWRHGRPEGEDLPDAGTQEAIARRGWKLGNPYWTGSARWIQYRVVGRVSRLRAHFLWSPVGSAPTVRRPLAAALPAAIPAAPAIVSRAGWGADESLVREAPSYADRLAFSVVHHTAGSMPSSRAQSAAIVRGILVYHVRSNGWNDIGYNFLVDPFGQVFEGRAGGVTRNVVGAHAQGFNTGSVGVSVLGTYDDSTISPEARAAVADLLSWRLDLAHVDPVSRLTRISAGSPKYPAGTSATLNAVSGHRDVGLTACPGTALYGDLREIAVDAALDEFPKLFEPSVTGAVGEPIRFTARLSESRAWTVTVFDAAGAAIVSGTGVGSSVDWTWDARAAAPGRYTYTIDAGHDVRPARGTIGPIVPLELSRVSVAPSVVTPNGDGASDTTAVSVTVTVPSTLDVRLEDGTGKRVATIAAGRAVRAGTTALVWRGKNGSGEPVPDGRYRVVVEAAAGTERAAASASLVVDRTLGHLSVRPQAFSPNGDGRLETAGIRFGLERAAAVRVRVLSGTRLVATLYAGSPGAAGAQALTWDGRSSAGPRARDGRLRVVVDATTTLGRRTLERPLTLDATAPRVTAVSARRARGGTLVRFRLSEPARLTVHLGPRIVRVRGRAGTVSLWRRVRAGRVSVLAEDAVGNRSRPAAARIRR